MSQKTNPISLRLQKNHKHFESCWYTDYFYNEMNSHDLQTRSYIQSVCDQITYLQAFLCTQNYYKRFVLYLFIQDFRGIGTEREHSLRTPFRFRRRVKNHTQIPVTVSMKAQDKLASILFFWHKETFGVSIFKPQESIGIGKSCISLNNLNNSTFNDFNFPNQLTLRFPFTLSSSKEKEGAYTHTGQPQKIKSILPVLERPTTEVAATSALALDGPIALDKMSLFQRIKKRYAERLSHLGYNSLTDNFRNGYIESINSCISSQVMEMVLMGPSRVSNVPSRSLFSTNLTSIYPIRIIRDIQNASFLINQVINLLQKQVKFKQIKDQILREILNASDKRNELFNLEDNNKQPFHLHQIIKGFRLSCSGRFGGRSKKAQKTKIQCIRWGQTSLHVFDSKLSFASKSVNTPFGTVGVKVWICYY